MEAISSIIRYCNPAGTGFSSFEKFGQMSTLGKCCAVAAAIFGAILGLGFGGIAAFRFTVEHFTKKPSMPDGPPEPVDETVMVEEPVVQGVITLGKKLGGGEFGVVYIPCMDGVLSEAQAIKVPSEDLMSEISAEKECVLLKKLNPKSDVLGLQKCIREVMLEDGRIGYLGHRYTMDLEHAIEHKKLSSKENKLTISYELISGLSFMHSKKIVHGDIMPANIFVDDGASPHAYLADLGIASDFSGPTLPKLMESPQRVMAADYDAEIQAMRNTLRHCLGAKNDHPKVFLQMQRFDVCALLTSIFKYCRGKDADFEWLEKNYSSEEQKTGVFITVFNQSVAEKFANILQTAATNHTALLSGIHDPIDLKQICTQSK